MNFFKFTVVTIFVLVAVNTSFAENSNVDCISFCYGLASKDIKAGIMSDMALLEFSFKNNSEMRTVTGVKYIVTLKDPFGETISQQELQFNCKIALSSTEADKKNVVNNPFDDTDLYDKIQALIVNETLGVSVEVT